MRAGCIIIKDMSNKENIVMGSLLFNNTLPQFELFKVMNQIFTADHNLVKNQTELVSNSSFSDLYY
jgi:5'(3')-deoxyribonucleotidase